jgi:hypothetical protein
MNMSQFPSPNSCIGACYSWSSNVCTAKGEFAVALWNLGKTMGKANVEESIGDMERHMFQAAGIQAPLSRQSRQQNESEVPFQRLPNPVFLFEITQLKEASSWFKRMGNGNRPGVTAGDALASQRAERFRQDLSQFLFTPPGGTRVANHLPLLSRNIPQERPGKRWSRSFQKKYRDPYRLRICKKEYVPLRRELMRIARISSVWIRYFFLGGRNDDIQVSSPDCFDELLRLWMHDPCNTTNSLIATAGKTFLQAHGFDLDS